MLDFFSNFKQINNSSSPIEKIKEKERFYNINDTLKDNKLAYGFFLDRKMNLPMNFKDIKSLSKYEWFAGSLSAEQFCNHLKGFLASPESNSLDKEFKQKIEKFITSVESSANQGALVDLARSTDLKLIFLILTGFNIGGSVNATPDIIKELTDEALYEINTLQPGEKRVFLVGSLFHETRLTVEKTDQGGYEVCYFDSATLGGEHWEFDCSLDTSKQLLLSRSFWDKIYRFKLSDSGSSIKDFLIEKLGIKKQNRPYADITCQGSNTCHYKGLLAVLKKEIATDCEDETLLNWTDFKASFGKYLLNNAKLDHDLKPWVQKKQELRDGKNEKIELFAKTILDGHLKETIESYVKAIHTIDPEKGIFLESKDSSLAKLKFLDKVLSELLKNCMVLPEELEFGKIDNPCVQKTLKDFNESLVIRQESLKNQLDNELEQAKSKLNIAFETVKTEWNKLLNTSEGYVLHKAPLPKNRIEEFLSIALSQANLLQHLNRRPAFVQALVQAIQMGKLEEVRQIYDRLEERDKDVLMKAISEFTNSSICLTKIYNMREFCTDHPQHDFTDLFKYVLARKAVVEGSLVDLLKFGPEDFIQDVRIRRLCIKPSREQIIEFFNLEMLKGLPTCVKTEGGSVYENPLDPSWRHIIRDVGTVIIQNRWFDLIDKAPVVFQKSLSEPVKHSELTVLLFENYLKNCSLDPSLKQRYQKLIELNKYSLGYVDSVSTDLLNSSTFDPLPNEFKLKLNQKKYSEGLKLLSQFDPGKNLNNNYSFIQLLIEDLLEYALSQPDYDLLLALLDACRKPQLSKQLEALVKKMGVSYESDSERCFIKNSFSKLLETIANKKSPDEKLLQAIMSTCFEQLDETIFEKVQNAMIKLEEQNIKIDPKILPEGFYIRLIEKFPNTYLSNFLGTAQMQKLEQQLVKTNTELQQMIEQKCDVNGIKKVVEATEEYYKYYKDLMLKNGIVKREEKV